MMNKSVVPLSLHFQKPDKYLICARYDKPRRGLELPRSVMLGIKIRTDYQAFDNDKLIYKKGE